MPDVTYEIVQHDGVFSEAFPTHADSRMAEASAD